MRIAHVYAYIALYYTTLRYIALQYIIVHDIAMHYSTLQYITLLHYATHYTTPQENKIHRTAHNAMQSNATP